MSDDEQGPTGAYAEQANISEDIEKIADNDPEMVVFNHVNYSAALDEDQWEALADALAHNTTVIELLLDNAGVQTGYCNDIAEALKTNKCLKVLDLKYNRIGVESLHKLAEMLMINDCLEVIKLDNQKVLPGPEAEKALAAVFDVNTTLLDLRLKCKELTCRTDIMKGEVRNKQIAKRIEEGQDWADLDPARRDELAAREAAERKEKADAEAEAAAPIVEKVENCGGPYTYKELTCLIQFQPDDINKKIKESYLPDDEFEEKFGCTKDEYASWPKWKKKNTKKQLNLH